MYDMPAAADVIASLVLQEFDKLPAKRKPVVRDNGLREWVPLSGIIAEGGDGKLTCLALATGMKCLPSSKLSQARGNVLHDWHAETLAIRAFNCFVLDECRALACGTKGTSEFIRRRSSEVSESDDDSVSWYGQPFTWREDVLLYMYCSEAPCGDASMELTMASQQDATPWAIPDKNIATTSASSRASVSSQQQQRQQPPDLKEALLLPGRAYFSQLGIVRRKPSRGDAPPTLSKSCSDKLSLHQCTSLFSSLTSLLVAPDHAYISTLVLPRSQYSAPGCRRAFSDGGQYEQNEIQHEIYNEHEDWQGNPSQEPRMASLKQIGGWGGGYKFHPFTVKTTDLEFAFSRRGLSPSPSPSISPSPQAPSVPSCSNKNKDEDESPNNKKTSDPDPDSDAVVIKTTPSPLSAAKTASDLEETTLNGVLQGRKVPGADIRAASFASRRRMWILALEVADLLRNEGKGKGKGKGLPDHIHILEIQNALGSSASGMGEVRKGEEAKGEEGVRVATTTKAAAAEIGTEKQAMTYGAVKESPLLGPRKQVKEDARNLALKGWVRNQGDEDFVL